MKQMGNDIDLSEMDAYGAADLDQRHSLRIEGSALPSLSKRQSWSKMQADRQDKAPDGRSNDMGIFGIKFGKVQ